MTCTWPKCECSGVYNCKIGQPPEIKRLNSLITEHTQLNSDSICARIHDLVRERDQVAALEAQIAIAKAIIKRGADYDLHSIDAECTDEWHGELYALALEAARLREPVGLVWQSDGGVLRSQNFSWGRYEVRTRYWGGFYPILCTENTKESILTEGSANAGSEDAAKAACAAHHAARYREMQGPQS